MTLSIDWRERVAQAMTGWLDGEDRLHQAMRYSALGGGKRIRPQLLLLAADACGGESETCLPAAVALEFVHSYSLVHDDLPAMDDDDERRGRPTCHVAFDEATAILAGDGLLTLAFDVLADALTTAPATLLRSRLAAVQTLARAAGDRGMVYGQMLDMQSGARTESFIWEVMAGKTAALIGAATRMGALWVGAAEHEVQSLSRFGHHLGLAFQIVDDLLDDGTDGDEAEGKATLVLELGRARAEELARQQTELAIASLEPLGARAGELTQLAKNTLGRSH